MEERDFQTKFTRWLNYRFEGSGVFELKITHENRVAFKRVALHQLDALHSTKHHGMAYKIPDDSRGAKPFDCFKIHGPAYLVIMFYKRGVNHFYMIDIDTWLTEVGDSARQSITEERAAEIGMRKEFA